MLVKKNHDYQFLRFSSIAGKIYSENHIKYEYMISY